MMKYLNLQTGTLFQMGDGENRRVVSGDTGAKHITLNYCVHSPGQEFAQHVHDRSEDMFIVLQGTTSIRQVNQFWPAGGGDAIWVPCREVHGIKNESDAETRFVSIQSPPDEALYTGERDSMHGAKAPGTAEGHRTRVLIRCIDKVPVDPKCPGQVRHVYGVNTGSTNLALDYVTFSEGDTFELNPGGKESVCLILEGRVGTQDGKILKPMDVIFLTASDKEVLLKAEAPSSSLLHAMAL